MVKIEFDTINAAFEDCPPFEAARIIRETAEKIEIMEYNGRLSDGGIIRDANGNRIGQWSASLNMPR